MSNSLSPRCPHCSRQQGATSTGVRRQHRTKDDPLAPRCPGSGQPMEDNR